MPLDTSIYNNLLRPPKSVAEYDAEAVQGQTNSLALHMNQAKLAEHQEGVNRTATRNALLGGFAPGMSTADQGDALVRGGFIDEGRKVIESGAKANSDQRAAEKAQIEGHFKKFELSGQIMGGVSDQATWDRARQQVAQVFGQEAATQMPAQYDPALVEQKRAQAMSVKEQLENQWKAKGFDLDVKKQAEQVRQFGVTDQRIQSEGAANRGVQVRGQNLVDARAKEATNGADISFTPDAITNAAGRYNTDGTLPPMGMGKSGSAGRAAILNKAAELANGVDPTQQRQNQITNKGDLATQNAAVRAFATGKDGQAIQSANTALNHLQTIRTLAQAQKTGDVRAFNQAARALGAQFGQAAPTNLNAALIMVGPEVSKAVVGVNGTGHEREQAIQALNPNGSLDQIIGGTQTMEELFGGRLTEARRTYQRTTKRTDFDDALLSPAARDVISRQHGAKPGAAASAPAPGSKPSLNDIFGK